MGRTYSVEGPAVRGGDPIHRCHAIGCAVEVPPRLLMCGRHWKNVPSLVRAEVWKTYRRGQEIDKRPSPAYLVAFSRAILAVAAREGRKGPEVERFEALLAKAAEIVQAQKDEVAKLAIRKAVENA